jgi:SAM-dependent methyltransferase
MAMSDAPIKADVDWRAFSEVFDYYASGEHGALLHEFYVWVVDQLDERELEPAHILEMGCGTGLLAEKLVEWYPEAHFELVDKFAPMLNRARERFEDAANVSIHETDGERYLASCAPGCFDLAVFCRSWYTMADPAKAAADLVAALEPGGLAMIYDFTRTTDIAAIDARNLADDPVRWPVCRAAMQEFNRGVEAGSYQLLSEAGMRELWKTAGAEVVAYQSHEPEMPNHRVCVLKR